MNKYFENLNPIIKEYFSILSDEIPEFLYDYINTSEMQRIGKISVACGTDYTKIHNNEFFYSNLEHSIAVALIIWNFTKDKKQTLAGLFHDISTPVFKHCIDFMNGDYEKQESTEELTTKIITDSKEIRALLKRDGIKVEEVDDYHIYPIADNDTPQLSSDRLEYTFTNGLGIRKKLWDLNKIKEIYSNIEIQKNESGIDEIGFKDIKVAEEFVEVSSQLSKVYSTNQVKLTMQFLADIVRKMSEKNLLNKNDLYTLSEKEVIERIENCGDDEITRGFYLFRNSTRIYESDKPVDDKYCISLNVKRRYIVPLVNVENTYKRINEVSEKAKKHIDNFLNWESKKYAYLDFNW